MRVEKKLDEVLRLSLKSSKADGPGNLPAMAVPFGTTNVCPLCQKQVRYQPVHLGTAPLDVIVIRECECKPVPTELPIKDVNHE